MSIPCQITFRDIDPSETVEAKIHERVARLERFADRATSIHVVIAAPHARPQSPTHKGHAYQFTIELMMPGGEIAVRQDTTSNPAHEDVFIAMRDAFDALERRAREQQERQKAH